MDRGRRRRPGPAAPAAPSGGTTPPAPGAAAGPARGAAAARPVLGRTLVISLRRVRLVLGPLGWSR